MACAALRKLVLPATAVVVASLLGGCARKEPPKPPPAIAVDVATAQLADVPVYLSGLGTVQAFYTVTVTARVDGQIEKVAFTEGQDVKKGALLVQIDPRPYRAALGVAIATRDKDRAQLENAFSAVANVASGSIAPTISRNALFGR